MFYSKADYLKMKTAEISEAVAQFDCGLITLDEFNAKADKIKAYYKNLIK